MRITNLNCDCSQDEDCDLDGCDIQVYLPGPAGPALVIIGTRSGTPGPAKIISTVAAPIARRQLSFIQGFSSPVNQPTIANPPDNGPWELALFVTDSTNRITLNNAANIELSGEWIGINGSILWLFWDGVSKYVEDHRNEI